MLAIEIRNARQTPDEGGITTAMQLDTPDLRIQGGQGTLQGATAEMAIHLGERGGHLFHAGRIGDHINKAIGGETRQRFAPQFRLGGGVELEVGGEIPGATGVMADAVI